MPPHKHIIRVKVNGRDVMRLVAETLLEMDAIAEDTKKLSSYVERLDDVRLTKIVGSFNRAPEFLRTIESLFTAELVRRKVRETTNPVVGEIKP